MNYEIEYMNMQYEIIWIREYEIIQFTYHYEYIYMNSYMHIQCIWVYELITKLYLHYKQFNMYIYVFMCVCV